MKTKLKLKLKTIGQLTDDGKLKIWKVRSWSERVYAIAQCLDAKVRVFVNDVIVTVALATRKYHWMLWK